MFKWWHVLSSAPYGYQVTKEKGFRGKGKSCALTSTPTNALRGNNIERASHTLRGYKCSVKKNVCRHLQKWLAGIMWDSSKVKALTFGCFSTQRSSDFDQIARYFNILELHLKFKVVSRSVIAKRAGLCQRKYQ